MLSETHEVYVSRLEVKAIALSVNFPVVNNSQVRRKNHFAVITALSKIPSSCLIKKIKRCILKTVHHTLQKRGERCPAMKGNNRILFK